MREMSSCAARGVIHGGAVNRIPPFRCSTGSPASLAGVFVSLVTMISIFKNRDKEKEGTPSSSAGRRRNPGEIRIQKDISELQLEDSTTIEFPNGRNDLLNFNVTIRPSEGMYKGGKFVFKFAVPLMYPHEAPKVKCETPVFHPNIDKEGNVCLNILREDWKPVLSITSIIYGLIFLFLEPNHDDPLNKEAADLLSSNRRLFEQTVARTLRGGSVNGRYYPRLM